MPNSGRRPGSPGSSPRASPPVRERAPLWPSWRGQRVTALGQKRPLRARPARPGQGRLPCRSPEAWSARQHERSRRCPCSADRRRRRRAALRDLGAAERAIQMSPLHSPCSIPPRFAVAIVCRTSDPVATQKPAGGRVGGCSRPGAQRGLLLPEDAASVSGPDDRPGAASFSEVKQQITKERRRRDGAHNHLPMRSDAASPSAPR